MTMASSCRVVQPPPGRPGFGWRALRGLSGVLAGGLVALAVTVGLAQWLAGSFASPGPGTATVAAHATAALLAVVLQVLADHARGQRAVLAAGAVLALFAGVLWFGWWA